MQGVALILCVCWVFCVRWGNMLSLLKEIAMCVPQGMHVLVAPRQLLLARSGLSRGGVLRNARRVHVDTMVLEVVQRRRKSRVVARALQKPLFLRRALQVLLVVLNPRGYMAFLAPLASMLSRLMGCVQRVLPATRVAADFMLQYLAQEGVLLHQELQNVCYVRVDFTALGTVVHRRQLKGASCVLPILHSLRRELQAHRVVLSLRVL